MLVHCLSIYPYSSQIHILPVPLEFETVQNCVIIGEINHTTAQIKQKIENETADQLQTLFGIRHVQVC